MKIEDIKIGQRIVLTKEVETLNYIDKNSNFKAGMKGTIIGCARTSGADIEFDDWIDGHDGNYRGKMGHCWWLPEEILVDIAKVFKRKNNY